MSHNATNWAIKQRGLKPGAKIVLWHLADCHNPSMGGTFPSQEYLAEQCEIPRSTLNVYLDSLEDAGLIMREQRRKPGSKQQERTRYFFPFDPEFSAKNPEKPCPETGHGNREAESRNEQKPSPENGKSRVQNLDSNPVREPVIEPVIERERAHEISEGEKPEAIERAYWALVQHWPGFAGMPKEPALPIWFKLTSEERGLATDRFSEWLALLKANKKSHVPAPSTYLKEKLWEAVVRAPVEVPTAMAAPFGKAWSAKRFRLLLRPHGPLPVLSSFNQKRFADADAAGKARIMSEHKANHGWKSVDWMHDQASSGQGTPASGLDQANGVPFQQVRKGSDLFEAWRKLHDLRGWPWLPGMGKAEWAYFPPIPAGFAGAPDEAVTAAINQFSELTARDRGNDDAA